MIILVPSNHTKIGVDDTITVHYYKPIILCTKKYNGGFLPDIILLTRCGYIGEPVWYHEEVLSLQPMFLPVLIK